MQDDKDDENSLISSLNNRPLDMVVAERLIEAKVRKLSLKNHKFCCFRPAVAPTSPMPIPMGKKFS